MLKKNSFIIFLIFAKKVVNAFVSGFFSFFYQVDSFQWVSTNSNGTRIEQTYYYSHLNTNYPGLVLVSTVSILIIGYTSLIIIIIVNILIYKELKKMMLRKRILMTGLAKNGLDDFSFGQQRMSITNRKVSNVMFTNRSISMPNNPNNRNSIQFQQQKRENQERESLKRILIMTLWVSLIHLTSRILKGVYRLAVIFYPYSPIIYYMNAFSFLSDALTYSSSFFVYMRANKMFRKKFFQIFLRRTNWHVHILKYLFKICILKGFFSF